MNRSSLKYFAGVTLISALLFYLADQTDYSFLFIGFITLFVFLGTIFSRIFIDTAVKLAPQNFVQWALLSTVVRFFMYAVMIFLLIYFAPGPMKNDIIYFALIYLTLTFHEIFAHLSKK